MSSPMPAASRAALASTLQQLPSLAVDCAPVVEPSLQTLALTEVVDMGRRITPLRPAMINIDALEEQLHTLPSKGNQTVFMDPFEGLGFDRDATVTRIVGTGGSSVGFMAFNETIMRDPGLAMTASPIHAGSENLGVIDKDKKVCATPRSTGKKVVSGSPNKRSRPAGSVNKKPSGIVIVEPNIASVSVSKKRRPMVLDDGDSGTKKARVAMDWMLVRQALLLFWRRLLLSSPALTNEQYSLEHTWPWK